MRRNEGKVQNIYLKPGEIFIAKSPSCVSTVLGSCVSVTMFDRRKEMGGICHAVLPRKTDDNQKNSFQYVDYSLERMAESFIAFKTKCRDVEIKLFGGSDMFEAGGSGSGISMVGKQNIAEALRFIEKNHFRLVASDTGGLLGRKIIFHTHTGAVFLKRLREKELQNRVNH